MVLDVISKLKGNLPFRTGVRVDDQFDQLNRCVMFLMMCLFGVVVTVRQHTGNIIACDGFSKFKDKFVEDYCWTQGLYTLRQAYDKPPKNIPYPGIVPEDTPCLPVRLVWGGQLECPAAGEIKPYERVYHLWYQWVPFYFWLVGAAFYMPYMAFKYLGFEEVKKLIVLISTPITNEEEHEKVIQKATTWLFHHYAFHAATGHYRHGGRRTGHWSSFPSASSRLGVLKLSVKLLYLCVSLLVFFLTGKMFGIGSFYTYGTEWSLSLRGPENRTTLIRDKLFPKMIACEIKRWGATGLEEENGTCVLAPNVVNQYLFLILWFLLVVVNITNLANIFRALVIINCKCVAYRRMMNAAYLKSDPLVKSLFYRVGASGRIVLSMLAHNTHPRTFEAVVAQLALRMKKTEDEAAAQGGQANGQCKSCCGGGDTVSDSDLNNGVHRRPVMLSDRCETVA